MAKRLTDDELIDLADAGDEKARAELGRRNKQFFAIMSEQDWADAARENAAAARALAGMDDWVEVREPREPTPRVMLVCAKCKALRDDEAVWDDAASTYRLSSDGRDLGSDPMRFELDNCAECRAASLAAAEVH